MEFVGNVIGEMLLIDATGATLAGAESEADVLTPLVYCSIHSLPIESWVVDVRAISERDRLPLGLLKSGSKLGPLRNRRSAVRIVTGDPPRIHQLEQERLRFA